MLRSIEDFIYCPVFIKSELLNLLFAFMASSSEELALLFPNEHENPENCYGSCRSRAANSCTSCGKIIIFPRYAYCPPGRMHTEMTSSTSDHSQA
ncbi:unnamed protein product [Rhizophagus irregularis]|nr:unnamed protein product [Rhizophagus irregularis]